MLTRTPPSADCQEPGWELRWAAGPQGTVRMPACSPSPAFPGHLWETHRQGLLDQGKTPDVPRPPTRGACPAQPTHTGRARDQGSHGRMWKVSQDRPGAGSDVSREPAAPSGGTRTPRVLTLLRHVSCCPLPPQADTGKQGRLGPPLPPPTGAAPGLYSRGPSGHVCALFCALS